MPECRAPTSRSLNRRRARALRRVRWGSARRGYCRAQSRRRLRVRSRAASMGRTPAARRSVLWIGRWGDELPCRSPRSTTSARDRRSARIYNSAAGDCQGERAGRRAWRDGWKRRNPCNRRAQAPPIRHPAWAAARPPSRASGCQRAEGRKCDGAATETARTRPQCRPGRDRARDRRWRRQRDRLRQTRTADSVSENRFADRWPIPPSSAVADRAYRPTSASLQKTHVPQGAQRLVERAGTKGDGEGGARLVDLLIARPVMTPAHAALVEGEGRWLAFREQFRQQLRANARPKENGAEKNVEEAVHQGPPLVGFFVRQTVIAAERMMQTRGGLERDAVMAAGGQKRAQ